MDTSFKPESTLRLDNIDIPHLDIVLDEVFLLPIHHESFGMVRPPDLAGLAEMTGVPLSDVIKRFEDIFRGSRDIGISPLRMQELVGLGAQIIDARTPTDMQGSLEGAARLACLDFAKWCKTAFDLRYIVVVCADGKRSFSAAMYLRELGLQQTFYLEGGVGSGHYPSMQSPGL